MESLHYLLMRAHTNLSRWLTAQAAGLGLSSGQPKVLECLAQNGTCNQKTIARCCEIEPATVGSILTRMERDGLVCRTQRADNRRSLYVALTPRGEALSREMAAYFQQADARAAALLSPEEALQLQELLQRVCAAVCTGEEGARS